MTAAAEGGNAAVPELITLLLLTNYYDGFRCTKKMRALMIDGQVEEHCSPSSETPRYEFIGAEVTYWRAARKPMTDGIISI